MALFREYHFALNLADLAKSSAGRSIGTLLPGEVLLAKLSKPLICVPFRCSCVVSVSV